MRYIPVRNPTKCPHRMSDKCTCGENSFIIECNNERKFPIGCPLFDCDDICKLEEATKLIASINHKFDNNLKKVNKL